MSKKSAASYKLTKNTGKLSAEEHTPEENYELFMAVEKATLEQDIKQSGRIDYWAKMRAEWIAWFDEKPTYEQVNELCDTTRIILTTMYERLCALKFEDFLADEINDPYNDLIPTIKDLREGEADELEYFTAGITFMLVRPYAEHLLSLYRMIQEGRDDGDEGK